MKIWKFEDKDAGYMEAIVNILSQHITLHDITPTQAYEFRKIMDWAVALPKTLKECPEEEKEVSDEEKLQKALDLLESKGYAIAEPKEIKVPENRVTLGPGRG
jgi:hypothetical protein